MYGKFLKLFFTSAAVLLICAYAFADFYDSSSYDELNNYLANRQSGSQPKKPKSSPEYGKKRAYTKEQRKVLNEYLVYLLYAFFAGGTALVTFLLNKMENIAFGGHALDMETTPAGTIQNNNKEIVIALRESDKEFGIDNFLEHAEDIFKTLKNAYSLNDINKLPLMTAGQLNEHRMQIHQYLEKGQKNITEIKNFEKAYLYKYNITPEYEYISAYLQTRLANYIINEETQKIIRGGDEIQTEKYLLVLRRDRVVLEPTRKNIVETVSCPKCGAPALINNMGHCVYCDAIIKTGNYVWFLDDIDIIWPDSRYSAGGVFINNKRTDRFKKELELNG